MYRDVFVFDAGWSDAQWKGAMTSGQPASLKHPSSKHAVANYSLHLFNNSSYHFNSAGEFSLNISAAHTQCAVTPSQAPASSGHSVLLWPDRLLLRNLRTEDIALVLKLALRTELIDARTLEKKLTAPAVVEAMSAMVVVSTCTGSPGFSYERARQSLAWFKAAGEASSPGADTMLIMAEDMRSHRAGTHVLVLPQEDCFELQLSSQERVATLLASYARK